MSQNENSIKQLCPVATLPHQVNMARNILVESDNVTAPGHLIHIGAAVDIVGASVGVDCECGHASHLDFSIAAPIDLLEALRLAIANAASEKLNTICVVEIGGYRVSVVARSKDDSFKTE